MSITTKKLHVLHFLCRPFMTVAAFVLWHGMRGNVQRDWLLYNGLKLWRETPDSWQQEVKDG